MTPADFDEGAKERQVMYGTHFVSQPWTFHLSLEGEYGCAWAGCHKATEEEAARFRESAGSLPKIP